MADTEREPQYKRSVAVTATMLDDELLCVNLDTGTYIGMKEVGQAVWRQLEVPSTFDEILRLVVSEYDVDEGRARADLETFMAEMVKAGLAELT
jgi:hypothetical protein